MLSESLTKIHENCRAKHQKLKVLVKILRNIGTQDMMMMIGAIKHSPEITT